MLISTKIKPFNSDIQSESVNGNEARAYIPSDFKGSTALGSTILINPKWYYGCFIDSVYNVDKCYATNTYIISPSNNYGLSPRTEVTYAKNKNDVFVISKYFDSNVLPFFIGSDILVGTNNAGRNIVYNYDEITKQIISTDATTTTQDVWFLNKYFYKNFITKPVHYYIPSIGQRLLTLRTDVLRFIGFNPKLKTTHAWSSTSQSITGELIGIYFYNNFFYALISNGEILKKDESIWSTGEATKYMSSVTPFSNVLLATQLLNGKYSFVIDINHNINVFKLVIKENNDIDWILDNNKTNEFRNLFGNLSSYSNISIIPQIDSSVYINLDKITFALKYDEDTDNFIEIENPCKNIIKDTDINIKGCSVNIADGICTVVSEISSEELELRYAKLIKTDLGTLEWVAYEPVRINYIPESLTSKSTGVIGEDSLGNNYVYVSKI